MVDVTVTVVAAAAAVMRVNLGKINIAGTAHWAVGCKSGCPFPSGCHEGIRECRSWEIWPGSSTSSSSTNFSATQVYKKNFRAAVCHISVSVAVAGDVHRHRPTIWMLGLRRGSSRLSRKCSISLSGNGIYQLVYSDTIFRGFHTTSLRGRSNSSSSSGSVL